ncbi:STE3-domain-containing protein [Rickenella mellea]|uniref:STE3-domain-containing protein n=1 Tax=Rickenella mellea TaxID=50990 RepID=A0A4Y7PVZ3_9AGAM|nr:STE3-domain-containing protein [Rickenella mellea]
MDPLYPLYSIFSFICFVLVLSPLPWHLQSWNTGTCMYMIWTGTVCLIWFINSMVWRNNAIDWAPVYCDIAGRIVLGAGIAIPTCSLCIQRRLYFITTMRVMSSSAKGKFKMVVTDICICVVFPMIIMAISYIPQGNRYDIYEDVGCIVGVQDIWPAYPTLLAWPLTIALISSVYGFFTLRSFLARRTQVNEFINTGKNSIGSQRYSRLMILSCVDIVLTIPFSAWLLHDAIVDIQPYVSWTYTHSYFSVIGTYPSIIWRNNKKLHEVVEWSRWNIILCAITFIAFFTFAEESRRNYGEVLYAVSKRFGCHISKPSRTTKSKSRRGTLPPMFPSRKSCEATFSVDADCERNELSRTTGSFGSGSTMVADSQENLDALPSNTTNYTSTSEQQPPIRSSQQGCSETAEMV